MMMSLAPAATRLPVARQPRLSQRQARAGRSCRCAAVETTDRPDARVPRGDTRGAVVLLNDVLVQVGSETLLQDISWRVEPGDKVGLVGTNGSGKSTLLRCLWGKLDVDSGELIVSPGANVGYLEQTAVAGSTRSVYEEAKSQAPSTAAAVSVARLEALVSAAGPSTPVSELSPLLESLEEAKAAFEAAGGASAEKRVAEVLEGLGFKRTQWDTPCAALSGGWQMRVALARLLLSAAGEGAVSSSAASGGGGLLLLDEPTNHLDQKSAEWLARFLKRSSATTILVSHDEALLESACDKFAEVRGKTLHLYKGSYRRFLEQREARAVQAASQRAKLAGQAEKLEGFINRFGAKATKASAAKSKQKALDKVNEAREEIGEEAPSAAGDAPGDATRVVLRLPKALPGAKEALTLERASFGWGAPSAGAPPQLAEVTFSLERNMRVAVLGPNGAGKSTLLKALSGALPLWSGKRKVGQDVVVGVFTQDLAQELPQEQQALEYVFQIARAYSKDVTEERVRTVMGSLGLTGEMPLRSIGSLSGGEKARVVLAAFVLRPSNCLLLDEPSNHLDSSALRALTAGLREYQGALLTITHNKAFCREFEPTHILRVADGSATLRLCISGEVTDADFWEEPGEGPGMGSQGSSSRGSSGGGASSSSGGSGGGGEGGGAAGAQAAAAGAQQQQQVAAPPALVAGGGFEDRKRLQKAKARIEKLMALIEAAEGRIGKLDAEAAAAFEARDAARGAKLVAEKEKVERDIEAHFAEAEELEAAVAEAEAAGGAEAAR